MRIFFIDDYHEQDMGGAYGQKNSSYSPSSPSHSISHSGSVTPNSSIHASPIGSFPSPPMLPEVVQLPFGQSAYLPNMVGGIAGINRPGMDPHFMQNAQMIDQRYAPQMLLPGQQMLPK